MQLFIVKYNHLTVSRAIEGQRKTIPHLMDSEGKIKSAKSDLRLRLDIYSDRRLWGFHPGVAPGGQVSRCSGRTRSFQVL
jgi:hypothetical protein